MSHSTKTLLLKNFLYGCLIVITGIVGWGSAEVVRKYQSFGLLVTECVLEVVNIC